MKWLLTWLPYKQLLPLFMDLPQSVARFGHASTGLCISAAQHYVSLTPPKTKATSSFPHSPRPSWEGDKDLGWNTNPDTEPDVLPSQTQPSLITTRGQTKAGFFWLKAKPGFQLLSPSILNPISKFRFEKASQRELMKIIWLFKQSINFLSLY